jgi:hypothetical protein
MHECLRSGSDEVVGGVDRDLKNLSDLAFVDLDRPTFSAPIGQQFDHAKRLLWMVGGEGRESPEYAEVGIRFDAALQEPKKPGQSPLSWELRVEPPGERSQRLLEVVSLKNGCRPQDEGPEVAVGTGL